MAWPGTPETASAWPGTPDAAAAPSWPGTPDQPGASSFDEKGFEPVAAAQPTLGEDIGTFAKHGLDTILKNEPDKDVGSAVENYALKHGMTPEQAKQQRTHIEGKMQRGNVLTLAGPLGVALSPVMGAFRQYASRPLEEKTGIPKEVTEGFTGIAAAGAGLKAVAGRGAAKAERPALEPPVAEVGPNPVPPPPKRFEPVAEAAPEKIVAAAIRSREGKVFTGTNHGDAATNLFKANHELSRAEAGDGFVTSTGRYVNRDEALEIASREKQTYDPDLNKTNRPDAWLHARDLDLSGAKNTPPPPPGFEPVPQSLSGAAPGAPTPGAAPLPPTYPEAVAAVQARIGTPPKEGILPKDIVAEVVDDLNPVARAERAAGTRPEDLDPTTSPYQALRLTRGSGGKVEQFLQHGTFDFDTLANKGGSFVDAVKPIRNVKDEFKAYLLAKRDLELEGRGIETGIDSGASQVVVKDAPPKIKAAADKLQKYQDDVLDYAHQSGIIGTEALAEMKALNRSYTPFYRVMDEGSTAPYNSRGFQTGRPTSMIKGSERQIVDPLESVIRNTQTFVQKAEHNRALKVLEDFSAAHPDQGILKPVKAPVRPIEIQPGEIARIADDLGVPEAALGGETMTIFRRSDKDLPPNVVQIFHDGKPKLYEVDPEIARAIKGMDNVDMGNFLRIIGAPSRTLRAGVVLDPTYMARNFIRDQFSATIQSQNAYRPVLDFASGLASRVKGGDVYQNWLKAGGAQSALMALDRSSAAVKMASKYGKDPTLGGKVKNVVLAPLDVLRVMSQVVDEATRLGEFKRSTKGSTNPAALQKGAFASREITTDFSKHGREPTIRALSQISEFMNAQIQGTAREAQAVKRQPGKTAAVTAAAITLPSVYLWLQNHDDPRYKNAPAWEKDGYWLIMPTDPKQEPWRIPKPWVFGMLGGSLVERSLDMFVDKKPEAYRDFATNLGKALLPNYIPTIAKPFIEQFSNKSLFTDRLIEPQRLKNVPPSERFTEQTPEILKKVGKATETSPLMLQNYVRNWSGTLGQNAVNLADEGYKALGLTDKAPAPTKGLADIPVIRAFVSRYPSANAQPIQDFYEKNNEIEQKVNARREAKRRGDDTTASDYAAQVDARTAGIKKQLDAGHREVRRVLNDREMTPNDKRETIRQTYLTMIDNAQRGLEIIRQDQADRQSRQKQPTEYKGP